MANVRRIGLSLGADLCWPTCYEAIMRRFEPAIAWGGDDVRVEVERLTITPFDLRQPCRYDVVLDRLTHWYHLSREWIKKSILMDDLYVLNNPWTLQSMEKATTFSGMMRLGLPVPATWLVPPKAYEPTPDLAPTLDRYAKLFSLPDIGRELGYPLYMKPYDGGAWVGVSRINSEDELAAAYEESGTRVMHLQAAVDPYDLFVRCVGIGPQLRYVNYDPSAPLHDRYGMETDFLTDDERSVLADMTLTINTFFGWDFNSCESLRKDGVFHPIDFANACPDSQVTSLHFHFPWLVISMLKWSLFCAVTRRPMRKTVDWTPYLEIAAEGRPFRDRLAGYAAIARERLDADRFAAFCDEHLSRLDEVAWEFFATDEARTAIRGKVEALYPEHEVDEFTEMFWGRIQAWREQAASGVGSA